MKFALLICFLGTSLAVSPFEAIVEEWEVISFKYFYDDYFISSLMFRPGNCDTERFTRETTGMPWEDTARRKALG